MSLMEEQIKTDAYTMEYYSALKKEKILSLMTMWMNLEGILLNEINQTQTDKC